MPRRRNTKNVKSSRPKPKAPEGTEGADLSEEERQEKLDLFLRDFDIEVASRRKKMLEYGEMIIKQIHSLYSLEMMKQPKEFRNMRIGDLMKMGSNGSNGLNQSQQVLDQFTSSLDDRIQATAKKRQTAAVGMETICEEGEETTGDRATKKRRRGRPANAENNTMATARPSRAAKHSSLRNQVATAPESAPTSASTSTRSRRVLRRVQETPAMNGGPSRAGWETPLITPKFDPRLPKTPAGGRRKAKPGEAISMVGMPMSLTGSPLSLEGDGRKMRDTLLAIPTAGCKAVQLPLTRGICKEEAISVQQELDEQTREHLRTMQENISRILQATQ